MRSLLQALSSVHHITMPACVGETVDSSNLPLRLTCATFIPALLASEVWHAIRHLCGQLLQALVKLGVSHPRSFLQGAPAKPTE